MPSLPSSEEFEEYITRIKKISEVSKEEAKKLITEIKAEFADIESEILGNIAVLFFAEVLDRDPADGVDLFQHMGMLIPGAKVVEVIRHS